MTTSTKIDSSDSYPTRLSGHSTRTRRRHPTLWPGHPAGPMPATELNSHARNGFSEFELIGEDELQRYWDELGRLATDRQLKADKRTVVEPTSQEVRSVFDVHRISDVVAEPYARTRPRPDFIAGRDAPPVGVGVR